MKDHVARHENERPANGGSENTGPENEGPK